jgi:PAS domain S-box-containing protein
MNNAEFQLRGISDPRLAVHATSPLPAWLWSTDGAHVLWANPAGAVALGAASSTALAAKDFGPADPHRRQVMHLAGQLLPTGAPRLERLRGFGAQLGNLATCACAQLEFSDGSAGILIAAVAPVGRTLPLAERLQRLVEDLDTPIAAFASDGSFVGASSAARPLLGFRNLAEAGLDHARTEALRDGRFETPIEIGRAVLHRVGSGTDVGLVALITPDTDADISFVRLDAVTQHIANKPEAAATLDQSVEATGYIPVEPLAEPSSPPRHETMHDVSDAAAIEPEMLPESVLFDAFDEASELPAPATAPSTPKPMPETAAAVDDTPPALVTTEQPVKVASHSAEPTSESETSVPPRSDIAIRPARRPLRFTWQMDADGHFLLGSDEFTRLIGLRTATAFGRPWRNIADAFDLDPEELVAKAVATRDTWSGITLHWPVDGPGLRLPVELSGLPVYDREQTFVGYRGFGVCRDLDALGRLAAQRHYDLSSEQPSPRPLAADVPHGHDTDHAPSHQAGDSSPPSPPTQSDHPLETPILDTPQNVVHLRPNSDLKSPALTPVENSAFNELARQLSERLELDHAGATETPTEAGETQPEARDGQFGWLSVEETAARGDSGRDKALLDLLPVGVLIYRLEQLLYANNAFVTRMGFNSLHALRVAGGLDAIYIVPNLDSQKTAAEQGTPVVITAQGPSKRADARLLSIEWNGETALALIVADDAAPVAASQSQSAAAASAVGQANAEELGTILDTTAEGVVMFDGEGRISACNRSAEALFGYDGNDMIQRNLNELFAPESQSGAQDYLAKINSTGVASLLDQGREVLGRVREGGFIPLSMTMGRAGTDSPNFFAVFRDLSQNKKSETELLQARRQSERGMTAKADVLARVSHEIRTPLNAIIGFAEVMIDERFGPLGNERYAEYLKDIRASGERVIAIVDEMLDLSRIETGKLELAFANQNLNDLVEQCVAVLQPRANRERIIIRTSLSHTLPAVVADARALRQIALNLIGSSIHLANAGGQVIVSTALSDFGDVVLRVRDTGNGLNDSELAAALEPYGAPRPPEQTPGQSGMSLSLAKALVEANRARFQIRSAPHTGTLIEVTFSHAATDA